MKAPITHILLLYFWKMTIKEIYDATFDGPSQ